MSKLIIILTVLLISACGSPPAPSDTPTRDASAPTSPAPHATDAPLDVPPSVSAPAPALTVTQSHQLPLDQPWVLIGETLVAVRDDGMITQLDVPVSDVIIAPDGSPVIIVHPDTSGYALRNTQTWTDLPLALPDGLMVQGGALLAPDGGHLAIPAWSQTDRFLVFIVNSATGAVRARISGTGDDPPTPLAWRGRQLFTHTQSSATSSFWRTDVAAQAPQPQEFLLVGHTGPWAMAPNGTALVWSYSGRPLYLRDLDTGVDYVLRDDPYAYVAPLISPDSATLALLQERGSSGCCELLFFDIKKRPPAPIAQAMRIDSPFMSMRGQVGWAWSPDSARLLVITSSQLLLLTPGGAVVGQVSRPSAPAVESFRLTADDRALLVTRNEPDAALRIIALTGDAAGSVTEVRLPASEGSYAVVYAPEAK
ncbi:MAG: hypothetical protein NZ699_11195 [Roseiflexus sp.]|nr:hypothetical protein [Roseiflexus sp.]MDW8232386.1 hypothetical protein [Roseiflexaceae bacterium]